MALITGRSSTSSRREKAPAGNRLSGTPRSLTEARSSVLPAGSSLVATTTCFSAARRGGGACRPTGVLCEHPRHGSRRGGGGGGPPPPPGPAGKNLRQQVAQKPY